MTSPETPSGSLRDTRAARIGALTGRALILVFAVGVVAATLTVPVKNWFGQRAEIAALQADVLASQARVAELQIELERWNDPAFVAAEARRRLHFLLPGEIGYVALGADGRPAEETLSETVEDTRPWFGQLWEAIEVADRGPKES